MSRLGAEDGFTLIELMIGAVLTVIVVGAVVMAMASALSSERSSSETRKTQAAAGEALELLGDDLRTAVASKRVDTNLTAAERAALGLVAPVGTKEGLKQILESTTSGGLQFRDVVLARPNELVFRSDVLSVAEDGADGGDTECVRWKHEDVDGSLWMVRTVWKDEAACPGAAGGAGVLDRRELFPIHKDLAGTRFRFVIQTVTDVDARECVSTPTDGAIADADLNRIGAIDVAFVAAGGGSSSEAARDVFGIRSRQTADYLYAIGCGY